MVYRLRNSFVLPSCLYLGFSPYYLNMLTAVGTRCADHVTPLYPQMLALTSPTGGGRSVGIVRSRTKATEFSFSLVLLLEHEKLLIIR